MLHYTIYKSAHVPSNLCIADKIRAVRIYSLYSRYIRPVQCLPECAVMFNSVVVHNNTTTSFITIPTYIQNHYSLSVCV